jgi:OPA family glycerol-3-phosphate transporter-like MFS transporter
MQATLLCGISRIFSETLEEPWLSRGAVSLNTIGAVGGVVNYLLAPILIYFFNWKAVFFTISTMLFLIGVVWCVVMPKLMSAQNKEPNIKITLDKARSRSIFELLRSRDAVCALFAVFIIGSLRESVSLWIPSYLSENFKLTVTVSTAITAVVPMLQISGALIAGRVGHKTPNLFFPALVTFILSTACFVIIPAMGSVTAVATVFLFVVNAISMTAALTFLLSLYPVRCMERQNIAKFVGILNFFVHLGDFAASTGFGWLSSVGGWNLTFSVMAILAFSAVFIAFLGMRTISKRG